MAAACAVPPVTTTGSEIQNAVNNLVESTVVVLTTETEGETNDTVEIQTMALLESAVSMENGSSDQVIQVIPIQDANGQEIQIIEMQQTDVSQNMGSEVVEVFPKTGTSLLQGQGNPTFTQSLVDYQKNIMEKKAVKKEVEEGKAVIEDSRPVRRSGRLPARRRIVPSKYRYTASKKFSEGQCQSCRKVNK